MSRFILCFILFIAIFVNAVSAKMKLSIEGLSGALQENVNARISSIDENKITDTLYFKRHLESEITKGLKALGYYNPSFKYIVDDKKLTIIVNPGKPILIEKVDVNLNGEGSSDKDYDALLKQSLPKVGTVLNHGDYDTFKKKLQSVALKKGYFDGELAKHELAVSPSLNQAFWQIDFDTGQRYKFGKVTFVKPTVRESYLQNIVPFKEGEYYTSDQLSLLSRHLSSSNWFSSVSVIPAMNKINENKELPIYVITKPKSDNIVSTGLGYSSDIGMRGKLSWNKPLINSNGHSLQSDLSLSAPEQIISGAYKIPLHDSPLENYVTLQGGYKKIDNNDTYSNSYSMGMILNKDSFEGWQRAVGLNVLFDNFTQADDNYKTFLLYPSFSFSKARTDGQIFPMWGDSKRYSLEVANDKLASDIDFVRIQFQQVWIRSINDSHRFVVRGNLGIIQVNDFDRVPPALRFFAGGDRSIRGFGYQSISPKDRNGKLTGASKLATGSVEYQYNLKGSFWGAAFIDTGEASDKFDKVTLHTGAGIGIRWASPIGPVKFDIARPIRQDTSAIHFYIGIGSEL